MEHLERTRVLFNKFSETFIETKNFIVEYLARHDNQIFIDFDGLADNGDDENGDDYNVTMPYINNDGETENIQICGVELSDNSSIYVVCRLGVSYEVQLNDLYYVLMFIENHITLNENE